MVKKKTRKKANQPLNEEQITFISLAVAFGTLSLFASAISFPFFIFFAGSSWTNFHAQLNPIYGLQLLVFLFMLIPLLSKRTEVRQRIVTGMILGFIYEPLGLGLFYLNTSDGLMRLVLFGGVVGCIAGIVATLIRKPPHKKSLSKSG